MRTVRPTLRALKMLQDGDLLPATAKTVLARAKSTKDVDEQVRILQDLRLDGIDVRLLRDARMKHAKGGGFTNKWTTADRQLGFPVFEVRDYVGAAWRGAVVMVDGDPWLVYATDHGGENHLVEKMRGLHQLGLLLPSPADLRLRAEDEKLQEGRADRVSLLRSLLNALRSALSSPAIGADSAVNTCDIASATGIEMAVGLSDLSALADSDDWGPRNAHKFDDVLALVLTLHTRDTRQKQWILDTCLPFLQADKSKVDYYNGKAMTVLVTLTRARLAQLLAHRSDPPEYETQDGHPPAPTVLHYADRDSITMAFVHGDAIRAVCGEWWVPQGDASTRPGLPICMDCEQELPAAQALRNMLRWWTDA